MDIDYVVGPPHAEWLRGAPPQVAVIRMFGVTAAGARPLRGWCRAAGRCAARGGARPIRARARAAGR